MVTYPLVKGSLYKKCIYIAIFNIFTILIYFTGKFTDSAESFSDVIKQAADILRIKSTKVAYFGASMSV